MTLNEHTLTCLVLFNDRGITLCAAAHNGKEMIQKNSFMSFFYVHDYRCVIHGCEKECRERHAVGFARQTSKAWALRDIFCLSTPSTKKIISVSHECNAMHTQRDSVTDWTYTVRFPRDYFHNCRCRSKSMLRFQLFFHLPYDY